MSTIPPGLEIPSTDDLTDVQDHMRRMIGHFGWTTDHERKFLLFMEEVGELAKAMRHMEKIAQEHGRTPLSTEQARANLAEELADVFNYLVDLANGYDIDIGRAYRDKMERNFSRSWTSEK